MVNMNTLYYGDNLDIPGFHIPFPQEDEKDRRIALEMDRRFHLNSSHD